MANDESTSAAIATGREKAEEILAGRRVALARRAEALSNHPSPLKLTSQVAIGGGPTATTTLQTAGFLVAAGDSWFDYPFFDVVKLLEDNYGYNVESAAHKGNPIEAMAYKGGQLDQFTRGLEKILAQGAKPKAALLSGGGNDIAGKEFGMLLNNATSPISGWNPEILDGLINERTRTAYQSILTSITHICNEHKVMNIPILVHGYDYPVPDGRGFWGGSPFPGPWLQPGFREKFFIDLETNVAMMRKIIDLFNEMLSALAKNPAFPNVRYVDLRGILSTDLTDHAYEGWWQNELHPTKKGFGLVTDKFAHVLSGLP